MRADECPKSRWRGVHTEPDDEGATVVLGWMRRFWGLLACAALKVPEKMHSAFAPTSIDYDARIFSFREWDWTFSLTLLHSRQRIKTALGDRQRRMLTGRTPSAAVLVKRRDGALFLHVQLSDETPPLLQAANVIGIDMGITAFLATSDGELIANPRHGREAARRLATAQQMLARKKRGSLNRGAARAVVANRHRKVSNQRRDLHHQVARRLVDAYDVIALEDLAVKNMTRSASGTRELPGTNVAAKRGLNRSILDAGWAQFAAILAAKAEEAGRVMVKVNPQYTS